MIDDGVERIDIVGAGMFSNMGASYKKHYEIITDILPFQGLNDHLNPIFHQSALITRKELGIPDAEWTQMRDACWLQNEWSAGITPKGAFFCELAGVLDMLLDGPGGWEIEPGWWKRTPDEFGDQLHWCELCGFALNTFTRDSAEEVDDVSPEWYERLKVLQSPKLKSGRVNVVKIENGRIADESKKENKFFSAAMPYIERYEDRFNALNSILFTRDFAEVRIADGEGFGVRLNKAIADAEEWILLGRSGAPVREDMKDRLGKYVLNPGTLHISGDFALFSKNALSLRAFGLDRIAHARSLDDIIKAWQPDKVIPLSFEAFDQVNKRLQVGVGVKYAIWGTGSAGSAAVDAICGAGGEIAAAVDKDCAKHGKDFYGVTIQAPEALLDSVFDVLIAANYTRFPEIRREAIEMGVDAAKVQYINNVLGGNTMNTTKDPESTASGDAIRWSYCPICHSGNYAVLNGIGKCTECGHGFRISVPAEIKTRYYDKQYWRNDKNRQGITTVSPDAQYEKWVAARIRLLESFDLISHPEPDKIHILEFGCAEGMLLYALKQRGYKVTGNDICMIAEEGARELGIEISTLPVEEFVKDGRSFDLIMSFHVVEHLRDPLDVMKNLSTLLSPGGVMLLHVPIDDQELGNMDHYHFFTNDSCLRLMEQITTDIRSDFVYYPIRKGESAIAVTYTGRKF
jgi:2-polyprenyl-3-methyl-5-hydroxy-6-metoxy-1,4-benzoquinol methylase